MSNVRTTPHHAEPEPDNTSVDEDPVLDPGQTSTSNVAVSDEATRVREERTVAGGLQEEGQHATNGETLAIAEEEVGDQGTLTPPVDKGTSVIRLDEKVTVATIANALAYIADEPGEKGELKFEFKASGKFGVGAVNAMVSGWAELSISYYISDTNFALMSVEISGALLAGIDLGGFINIQGEVGLGMNFLHQWFSSRNIAASWIVNQLRSVDEKCGGGIIDFGSGTRENNQGEAEDHARQRHSGGGDHPGGKGDHPGEPKYEVHSEKVFAGVKAQGGFGPVKGDASYRATELYRTYHDHETGAEIVSRESHREVDAGLSFGFGKGKIEGRYHGDWSNTTGSPVFFLNGIFCEHNITLSFQLNKLLDMKLGKQGSMPTIPASKVQSLCLSTFSALEMITGPFPHMAALNAKLFNAIVAELYKVQQIGAHLGGGIGIGLNFNWNEYGESDDTKELMYFRVKVEPKLTLSVGGNTVAGGAEFGASLSKSEVVYETIGSSTVSYINRRFLYSNEDNPWEDFLEKNRAQVHGLVRNMATPGFNYYNAAIENAFHEGGGENYEAGLEAMYAHWTSQNAAAKEVQPDCARVGDELLSGTSFFTWFASTKRKHMTNIMNIFKKYENDPQVLKFFFDTLPGYGIDLQDLYEFAVETGFKNRYAALRQIALASNG